MAKKNLLAFLAGFLALFFVWAGWAIVKDISVNSILSTQIGMLFPGKPGPTILGILTGIIGGIPAGLGALSACLLKKMF